MAGQDDDNSFASRLRATRGAAKDEGERAAEEAEAAFAPLLSQLRKAAHDVDGLNDPQVRMHVDDIEMDGDGVAHSEVALYNNGNRRRIKIKYGPAFGTGYKFFVDGLDEAKDYFKEPVKNPRFASAVRQTFESEFTVPPDRVVELAGAIEEVALKFFSK